jgi:hypothetical protein
MACEWAETCSTLHNNICCLKYSVTDGLSVYLHITNGCLTLSWLLSIGNFTGSKDAMFIYQETDIVWKETVVPLSRYCPDIHIYRRAGTEESHKTLSG